MTLQSSFVTIRVPNSRKYNHKYMRKGQSAYTIAIVLYKVLLDEIGILHIFSYHA